MSTPDILKLQEKMKSFQQEIAADGKRILLQYFQTLFEAVPQLEKMTWTQYTPGFNDGDPCYFTVHEPRFTLNVASKSYADKEIPAGEEVEYIPLNTTDPVLSKILELTRDFQSEIMVELLKVTFGDYSHVIVDKDLNVTRNEYYD